MHRVQLFQSGYRTFDDVSGFLDCTYDLSYVGLVGVLELKLCRVGGGKEGQALGIEESVIQDKDR